MRVPPGVKRMDELPDEYEHDLASLAELQGMLIEMFPEIDLGDPTWAVLEDPDFSIEFNLGEDDPCQGIMLHVRGGDGALAPIRHLCEQTGWMAFDPSKGDFIDLEADPGAGLRAWRAFRDQVIKRANQGEEDSR